MGSHAATLRCQMSGKRILEIVKEILVRCTQHLLSESSYYDDTYVQLCIARSQTPCCRDRRYFWPYTSDAPNRINLLQI